MATLGVKGLMAACLLPVIIIDFSFVEDTLYLMMMIVMIHSHVLYSVNWQPLPLTLLQPVVIMQQSAIKFFFRNAYIDAFIVCD